jgi:hypothetical protein
MRTRNFLLAAVAAILGAGQAAYAQYGPMPGPAGPYPDMMAGGGMGMGGPGYPGPNPYAPPAFAPAAYAGMGGPAPMGGPMGPMPQTPTMAPLGIDGGMSGMGGTPMQGGSMMGGGMPGGGMGGSAYCDDCGPAQGGWTNRYFAWGEFMYLQPKNAEVAYAVPVYAAAAAGTVGPPAVPGAFVQAGNVHRAELDYQPAFRAGFGFLLSPRSAIAVSYSQFNRNTFDSVELPGTGAVLDSLVSNPNSPEGTAADGNLSSAALLQTQFKILDIDYRGLFVYNPEWQINYVVGARYGNLEQHIGVGFAGQNGFQQVLAETEFDGGGLKLGLEGLRFHPATQFFFYGKGYASFLAGQFRSKYEFDPVAGNPTLAGYNVARLVTMLDLETGIGWQNYTGNIRLSAGYMMQSWYNTVRLNDFINSVRANNFVNEPASNVNGMITFDGLVTKVELLW